MTRLKKNALIFLSKEKAAGEQIRKSNTLKDKFFSSTSSSYLTSIALK